MLHDLLASNAIHARHLVAKNKVKMPQTNAPIPNLPSYRNTHHPLAVSVSSHTNWKYGGLNVKNP